MTKVLNLILLSLLSLDLGFQSTDFDFDSVSGDIRVVVFGLQVLVQVLVCLVFFTMLTSTYLFQVGLLDHVLREFWPPLILQIFYLLYTILLGIFHMRELDKGENTLELWENPTFICFNGIMKILANIHYIIHIRVMLKLQNEKFYSSDARAVLNTQNSLST
uniref:Transmembrane protein 138 n=1 Tax=Leptocylindrus danicus TaxID=163516 RepID=A0A7S2L8T9_9STRA|mmetsp:Transcript_33395/g.48338  ORF Transcript_33395/g.48338 Transcript_33395/m.48338 type:complete len:162 (+) Transcript_33395:162-647(+)